MKNMYTRNLVCLFMFLVRVSSNEIEVGVGVVLDANSLEGILGLRDPREQAINASASDLDEYVPYAKADGTSAGSYNDLVHQAFLQGFNAAMGDDKITANRSMYVDFTIPYAKGEVSMIFKSLMHKFLLIIAYFIQAGATIWILKHMVRTVFGDPPSQHIGMLFSTLVFSQREKLGRNLDRFVVVVWVPVVLILTSTYTATLSSMLTYTASTGGRDVNRLEYFSMTTFNPRHAREIPDFDNGGSGGGGGGYSSAARGQLREMDTGGMQHWWKKVWCFLRKMAPGPRH